MLKTRLVILVWALALVSRLGAQTAPSGDSARGEKDVAAAQAILEAQVAAWNRGDVVAYMDGYAREDSTTFVSGDTIVRGWQTVLDRYKTRYNTRKKMGTLAFTELEFTRLSEAYVLATGRWQLTREGDTPRGRFTLLFRHTPAGWRIVHDHTSSES